MCWYNYIERSQILQKLYIANSQPVTMSMPQTLHNSDCLLTIFLFLYPFCYKRVVQSIQVREFTTHKCCFSSKKHTTCTICCSWSSKNCFLVITFGRWIGNVYFFCDFFISRAVQKVEFDSSSSNYTLPVTSVEVCLVRDVVDSSLTVNISLSRGENNSSSQ